jgi:hypothetical protein
MRLCPTGLLALAVASAASGCSATPDALHRSITEQNVDRVRALLKRGVPPLTATTGGETPLKAALIAVTGPVRDPGFSQKKWAADSPPLLILQEVMRAVRTSTHAPFDMTGELALVMQPHSESLERGMTFVTSVYLKGPSRQYELAIAAWETALVGIDRSDGWNPVLRPGSRYHVVGAEKNDLVEAYRLELVGAPAGQNAFTFPIMNYLPSTFEYMRKLTWLGEGPGR